MQGSNIPIKLVSSLTFDNIFINRLSQRMIDLLNQIVKLF
jgi:hypothetical protein